MSRQTTSDPPVTIGLAVYNGERYVTEAVESVLGQTYKDFVLLISDNASTDQTGEICRQFASDDPRVRYHRNETNIGMAGNYNLLFRRSRSKYFRWATADDYSNAEMLADAVELMEGMPELALCYPRAFFVDSQGKEIGRWEDELHLLQDDPLVRFRTVARKIQKVHHHLGLMRSSFVSRTGLLGKHVSSDMAFVAEMSLYGKFFQIPKHQFFRRMHEDSSSWATEDEEHQAKRYHASSVDRIPFNALRFHWGFVQAVHRSPLAARAKLSAYAFLARRAWWNKDTLGQEVRREARLALTRVGRGTGNRSEHPSRT